ncbi:MAG: METTL5 family protein [Desulfurococcaceae archaeon TW002]
MRRISRKWLGIVVSGVPDFKIPKEELEQYVTPADIVADLVWSAFMAGDIEGRVVHDLGCGTGRLALASSMLNSKYVVCSDVDEDALSIASEVLMEGSPIPYDLVLADLREAPPFRSSDCVVVMNPPFGVKSRGADIDFLKTALTTCSTVYSIHKLSEGFREVLEEVMRSLNSRCDVLKIIKFPLRASLSKHRKKVVLIDSVIVRASRNIKDPLT